MLTLLSPLCPPLYQGRHERDKKGDKVGGQLWPGSGGRVTLLLAEDYRESSKAHAIVSPLCLPLCFPLYQGRRKGDKRETKSGANFDTAPAGALSF